MSTCFLVTAIGTINGTAIINELRTKVCDCYILGADIYPANYVVNSRDVDEFYQFPPVMPDVTKYIGFLKEFCVKHHVNAIYSVIDEEVQALVCERDAFSKMGVLLCAPDKHTVELCHNKKLFNRWLKGCMPEYCIKTYESFEQINEYPVFVKPVHGRASAGCKKVENCRQLEELNIDWVNSVVQEFVTGDMVAVDAICNPRNSQFFVVQRKELLRNSNGCGIVVEIIDDERLTQACRRLANEMQIEGVVNVEFFVKEDCVQIIEVNPRLPAGTAFSCLAGGNTVCNALHIARGESCEVKDTKIGTFYARRYETYEM